MVGGVDLGHGGLDDVSQQRVHVRFGPQLTRQLRQRSHRPGFGQLSAAVARVVRRSVVFEQGIVRHDGDAASRAGMFAPAGLAASTAVRFSSETWAGADLEAAPDRVAERTRIQASWHPIRHRHVPQV
ncbi:hypothetical protein [Jatrophihabitans endophyticus]|uniref:hypothetical protein n=1 Tax=Jatrophihabitans endophyticus TaxID=1206085 RepID=UPI0026EF45CF|nr:hypothetical protein [Jatrophihabitans endophyticus]